MSNEIRNISEIQEKIAGLEKAKLQIMSPIKAYKIDVALSVLNWVLNGDN